MKKITKLRRKIEDLSNEEKANILAQLVCECNGYDGSLEDLYYYENDEEFFNMMFENNPLEAVRSAHYGEYGYTDTYVKFNGYGNLESISEWDRDRELIDSEEEIIIEVERLLEDNNIDIDWLLE